MCVAVAVTRTRSMADVVSCINDNVKEAGSKAHVLDDMAYNEEARQTMFSQVESRMEKRKEYRTWWSDPVNRQQPQEL